MGLISQLGESLIVFLEFWWDLGYILELGQGWLFKTLLYTATSELMSSCTGHFGILLEGWQGNRDASPDEAGDTASLSIFHRDIGIPINFLEESGIVSF